MRHVIFKFSQLKCKLMKSDAKLQGIVFQWIKPNGQSGGGHPSFYKIWKSFSQEIFLDKQGISKEQKYKRNQAFWQKLSLKVLDPKQNDFEVFVKLILLLEVNDCRHFPVWKCLYITYF